MNNYSTPIPDPFRDARQKDGVLPCEFQGESIPMILRHADVRQAARDFATYSSNAPFRVPIPSEEEFRSVRQLPIETDPPEHTEYRQLVEPFFQRAKTPEVAAAVEGLVDDLIEEAVGRNSVEIVHDFALPLQSKALTFLLNVPLDEAKTWIGWGVHVFREGEGTRKGAALEAYLQAQFDRAAAQPGDDFFSALTRATYQGRPLTREELLGYGNLTFAGGRDTVINAIACVIGYIGEHPEALPWLAADPKRILQASEEFFRAFTGLTHIGRVCPVDTTVQGVPVKAGGRVSLCWASANQDETVFDSPGEVRLGRKPNPHIAFGFGAHLCLGAAHARLIVRTLLDKLSQRAAKITVLEAHPHVEHAASYSRPNGYTSLSVSITAR